MGPSRESRPVRHGPAAAIWTAAVGAAVVTAGVQGIAPAIPAVAAEFSLSPAEVALVTSVYLFPSVFSALAAGMLADRVGMRAVFTGSLLLFGLPTFVLMAWPTFPVLMVTRFVQGAAFGAAVSLSVAMIGLVVPTGAAAARAQSRRIIAMTVAEAVFPALAGVLVVLSWMAPFVVQLVAVPLGVAGWFLLPPLRSTRTRREGFAAVAHAPAVVGVQTLGAFRFVFKFPVLTFYPLVAVEQAGLSAAVVGLVMGASSLLAAVSAAATERFARRWSSAQLIGGSLVLATAAVGIIGIAPGSALLVVLAMVLFALQDGVYGVAHNVLVTEMAPPDARSTYVGLTGTVRNVGKFVSPLAFGAVTLALTVSQTFLVMVAVGAGSLAVARHVSRVQARRVEAEAE